ncbi:MAG: hypothetical protein M3176_20180, partial [Chloroflexota bacterium]|nr:hypothetical protein [Chloroflexota bacterium]
GSPTPSRFLSLDKRLILDTKSVRTDAKRWGRMPTPTLAFVGMVLLVVVGAGDAVQRRRR